MTAKYTILGKRIRECRKSKNLKQDELADILKNKYGLSTTRETVSKWEIGFQEPTITPLKYMAEIFGVSLDYLNGKSDDTRNVQSHDYNKITRQSLKDDQRILLDLWGEIGDEEKKFFMRQLERAAKERGETDNDE